jgi:hypothetical protein
MGCAARLGGLHCRLAAGYVTGCQRDGTARIVTFASGATVREESSCAMRSTADCRGRLWTARTPTTTAPPRSSPTATAAPGSVWTSDLRPDALAAATARAMEHGLAAIKRTLESDVTDPESP